MRKNKQKKHFRFFKSFTFIDVLVGTSLTLIVFLGIFGGLFLALKTVKLSQNKITATSIANEWLEKIRNLPYSAVGTKGASLPFAKGVLDQSTTTQFNNITYNIETKVKYISDPADGLGEDDNCDLDYKRVQVKVSFSGKTKGEVVFVTDVAPKDLFEEISSCESQPGGILSVSVFDAFGQMVSFPTINIYDIQKGILVDSVSPSSGRYDFPLATSTYKIEVLKQGYSFSRTYGTEEVAIPENACYARGHQKVLKGQITSVSFCIDQTSNFSVNTFSPWGRDYWRDSFEDESKISTSSQIVVQDGEVMLSTTTSGHTPSGFLISQSITPSHLISWDEASFSDSKSSTTDIKYQFLFASGTDWILIPDSDLPGNSQGFESPSVDLSSLSTTTYSSLKLKAILSTNSTSSTPFLYAWEISWRSSQPTPIPNVEFHLRGEKLIGYDEKENPIYKYSQTHTTDSEGHIDILGLEWDSYYFSIPTSTGLDLVDISPSPQPIDLPPDNFTQQVDLYLDSENSLLVVVEDEETLEPVFGASTTLSSQDYEKVQKTNQNGEAFFIPLSSTIYDLFVSAPGYLSTSTSIFVSGDETKIVKIKRIE